MSTRSRRVQGEIGSCCNFHFIRSPLTPANWPTRESKKKKKETLFFWVARWLISLGCRCVISDSIETLGSFLFFFSNLKAVPRPAGPYPLANTMPPPPFPFSLSAASRVLLLTLIPNRCCHFCLASAPDYTTGVCHKNPLSPVSSTQHKDQLLQMKRDIRDFNNIAFSLSLSFAAAVATPCPCSLSSCFRWQL